MAAAKRVEFFMLSLSRFHSIIFPLTLVTLLFLWAEISLNFHCFVNDFWIFSVEFIKFFESKYPFDATE